MNISKNTKVSEIMKTVIITVDKKDSLQSVDEIFESTHIHHLPVMENGELVGMLSQGDLLIMKDWGTTLNLRTSEINNREVFRSHTAGDVMSTEIVSVKENTTLGELAILLKPNKYHAFPVLKEGKLVGIISTYDVIQNAFS